MDTMIPRSWKKVENEAGYPIYVDESTGKQHYDHPEFFKIVQSLDEYNGIKYNIYRIAFKVFALQRYLQVPPLRICSGVFARHQLSLSESSLSLDTTELEAVLADIYFAAEKEGLFSGDVDHSVDLLINLLLNVYDKERKEPLRVLAAKTLLILLSSEPASDKWFALANSCSDHNGCVSARRLGALLTYVGALPMFCDGGSQQVQDDVDSCFDKSPGMLGLSARSVAEWGVRDCSSARWLSVVQRVVSSRSSADEGLKCAACSLTLAKMLKFKCSKCSDIYFCEKCYLYDKGLTKVNGHKKTHVVQEIIDGQPKPSECLGFMKGVRRLFFCTKTKKKTKSKKIPDKLQIQESVKRKKGGKTTRIFTSTVGKASGNTASNPATMLQDIIVQLETQNKALMELSSQLEGAAKNSDDELKSKVEDHWSQISTQIARLKLLKDNLTTSQDLLNQGITGEDKDRPQAFDLFSPIPVLESQSKITVQNQPRVLSLDSGNFSVISKRDGQNLVGPSNDVSKPVVMQAATNSISSVSMNDISSWHNETESLTSDKRARESKPKAGAIHEETYDMTAERKFAADLQSVETSNDKMKELNADLDTVLDRLQQILTNNFAMDDSTFDNSQLRETANEMEGLLGTLIRGVEQRATLNASKGLV